MTGSRARGTALQALLIIRSCYSFHTPKRLVTLSLPFMSLTLLHSQKFGLSMCTFQVSRISLLFPWMLKSGLIRCACTQVKCSFRTTILTCTELFKYQDKAEEEEEEETLSPHFAARQRFLRLNFNTNVTGNDFKSSNDSP